MWWKKIMLCSSSLQISLCCWSNFSTLNTLLLSILSLQAKSCRRHSSRLGSDFGIEALSLCSDEYGQRKTILWVILNQNQKWIGCWPNLQSSEEAPPGTEELIFTQRQNWDTQHIKSKQFTHLESKNFMALKLQIYILLLMPRDSRQLKGKLILPLPGK